MAEKISGVYKITNTITGDFYIGSSKDIKERWTAHKSPSRWKRYPNNPMYLEMKKYGVDKFDFEILEEAEIDRLKKAEQQFIEMLKPTYNDRNANGWDFKRHKETKRKYNKRKEYYKEYKKQLCLYNGETMTINALYKRFKRHGISHPQIEAKKYLI